jgi:hypothetical protein
VVGYFQGAVFHATPSGRKPVARASDRKNHVHFTENRGSAGIGCIASRLRGPVSKLERVARELGVSPITAAGLIRKGLV